MTKIYDNITELIGQTPIVKLQHVPAESADVYVKLEAFNPGGSVKDRIALAMIRAAEDFRYNNFILSRFKTWWNNR